MAQLFVLSGSDVGRSFDVRGGDTIGRSQDCILVFRDASISRHHAHLEEREGTWTVVDDGSRNGIVVGGVRSKRIELADGEEFLLGEVLLRFRCEAQAETSSRVAEPPPAPVVPEPAQPTRPGPPRPAPPPRAAPAQAEADELVLEGADEIDLAATARVARPAPRPASREGLAEQRGRILQYHRVPETGSRLSLELAQLPAWKRIAVYLLALLVFAAVTVGAFLGAAFVKERLGSGGAAPTSTETPPGDG